VGGRKMPNDNSANSNIETKKKAIDLSLEWSKQIISLSTGTLILSGTFIKDIFKTGMHSKNLLIFCWASMVISIFCGMLFLGTLIFMLNKGEAEVDSARGIGLIHILTFFVGLVSFFVFVWINI
jgi:hypothetical protein